MPKAMARERVAPRREGSQVVHTRARCGPPPTQDGAGRRVRHNGGQARVNMRHARAREVPDGVSQSQRRCCAPVPCPLVCYAGQQRKHARAYALRHAPPTPLRAHNESHPIKEGALRCHVPLGRRAGRRHHAATLRRGRGARTCIRSLTVGAPLYVWNLRPSATSVLPLRSCTWRSIVSHSREAGHAGAPLVECLCADEIAEPHQEMSLRVRHTA